MKTLQLRVSDVSDKMVPFHDIPVGSFFFLRETGDLNLKITNSDGIRGYNALRWGDNQEASELGITEHGHLVYPVTVISSVDFDGIDMPE